MNYVIEQDGIYISEADTFEPESILTSGQLFRFGKLNNGSWWVVSDCNYATIVKTNDSAYVIHTSNVGYFVKFFDLDTDYDAILDRLFKFDVLRPAIEFGKGVRMLRQSLPEVIISFIISANNNIPRIRKSVEALCVRFGTQNDWGYSFPTIEQLLVATEADFVSIGCGYRSAYLVDTIHKLYDDEILSKLLSAPNTAEARKILLSLKGVGPKVADCILLFGLGRFDVFPVDTWIDRVYHEDFGGAYVNREKISAWFVEQFGQDSGYCQQYLFYYKRKDIKLK